MASPVSHTDMACLRPCGLCLSRALPSSRVETGWERGYHQPQTEDSSGECRSIDTLGFFRNLIAALRV
jgi:hypothetical protein